MDIINNPHDAFFKSTFGQIDMAKGFMENYLPAAVLKVLDMDTLSPEPNSFLSNGIKGTIYRFGIQS